jgi:hypothetical protein
MLPANLEIKTEILHLLSVRSFDEKANLTTCFKKGSK